MRNFPYITIGQIVEEIQAELKAQYLRQHPEMTEEEYDNLAKQNPKGVPTFERVQFYRLSKPDKLNFPEGILRPGGWRKFTPEDKEEIKRKLREYYVLPTPEE